MKATTEKKLGPGDDLEMMSNPGLWPVWPLLPIKRYKAGNGFPECGLLVAVEGAANTVFVGNLFAVENIPSLLNDERIVRHRYDSLEKLLQDGWVVD